MGHKPDFALAYRDVGTAFDLQGLDLEAVEAFRRAIALSPKLAGGISGSPSFTRCVAAIRR